MDNPFLQRRYLVGFEARRLGHIFTDVLVIGAGAAGLRAAIEAAEFGEVIVAAKDSFTESNTSYAQGGLAAVLDDADSVDDHIADTVRTACGLGDEDVIREILTAAPGHIRQLQEWGMEFDTDHGQLALAREGGHSINRVAHAAGDATGRVLVDTLPALGEHAKKHNTYVLLEPLNRKEAFFLRQVADAASIARDCKSQGIAVMGDFYHMYIEEPSDMGAFISGGPLLRHVHLASRTRVLPGQDERQFVDGFRGLKWIGYRDYCSFECGVRGDRETEIPKSMAFLRQQWSQA